MKRKAGITIWMILVGLVLSIAGCGGADSGGNNNSGGSYSISGKITDTTGAGLAVVTVALSGASTASVATDSTGSFTFTGLANGTYAIAPSKSGSTFAPTSKAVSVNNANLPGQDFAGAVASGSTYAISGKVSDSSNSGISGVTMTISGANTGATVTDSSGNYSLAGLGNGSYTVTPAKSGNTFNPSNRAITVNSANSAGQDFAGSSAGAGGNTTSTNYYPVAVGNKWAYSGTANSVSFTQSNEIISSSSTNYSEKMIYSYSSGYYYVADYVLSSSGSWGRTYNNTYTSGGSIIASNTTTYSPPALVFTSKTDIGTHETGTYTLTSGGYSTQITVDIEVIGNESVTVPAGTFNDALKLTYKTTVSGSPSYEATAWFANGVGFVKFASTSSSMELTSYTIQ